MTIKVFAGIVMMPIAFLRFATMTREKNYLQAKNRPFDTVAIPNWREHIQTHSAKTIRSFVCSVAFFFSFFVWTLHILGDAFFFVIAVTHCHCLHFPIKRIFLRRISMFKSIASRRPYFGKTFVDGKAVASTKKSCEILMGIEINAKKPIEITKGQIPCGSGSNCMSAKSLQSNLLAKFVGSGANRIELAFQIYQKIPSTAKHHS